jgi:hypothetical protein
MMMLRNIQGLHAPLKLQMERSLASQVIPIVSLALYGPSKFHKISNIDLML